MEGEGYSLEAEVKNQDKREKLSPRLVMAEKPEVSPLEEAESMAVNGNEGSFQDQDSINPENPQHLELQEENFQQKFRNFRYKDASGPRQLLQHLRQLSRRWLDPEVHTKEQMIEVLVQEQFQAITDDGITRKNPPIKTPPGASPLSAEARRNVP